MLNGALSVAVLVLGVLAQNSAAYFRMSCSQMQIGRIDPVVNPGALARHAHKISGPSSKYSPYSAYDHRADIHHAMAALST